MNQQNKEKETASAAKRQETEVPAKKAEKSPKKRTARLTGYRKPRAAKKDVSEKETDKKPQKQRQPQKKMPVATMDAL